MLSDTQISIAGIVILVLATAFYKIRLNSILARAVYKEPTTLAKKLFCRKLKIKKTIFMASLCVLLIIPIVSLFLDVYFRPRFSSLYGPILPALSFLLVVVAGCAYFGSLCVRCQKPYFGTQLSPTSNVSACHFCGLACIEQHSGEDNF